VTRTFAITFDYRCPYARIAHDHVIAGLRADADWDVTFLPFSLGQAHVEEGGTPVWEQPEVDSGLLALQLGIAVRDTQPGHFFDVHEALFAHRHVAAGDLRDRAALSAAIAATGVDVDAAWAQVDSGAALSAVEKEHTRYVDSHRVFGVPTFIVGDAAVFVRLLHDPEHDSQLAVATIERVLDQLDWPMLNEFKHTSIPR
jgi:2-hydroxychromene-2-carboxylate isomerase